MLRGDWSRYDQAVIAVLGSLVFVLLLVLTWSLASLDAGYGENANQAAANYKERAQERISSTCQDRELVAFAKCVQEIVETSHEAQTSERDLGAQQSMALWAKAMFWATLFSIGVTVVGIYFVWKSLGATHEAIASERETSEAQVRAYVTIRSIGIYLDRSKLIVQVKLMNSGNSPAFLGSIKCCFGESYVNPNVLPNYNLPAHQLFGMLRHGDETKDIFLASPRMISKQEEANLGATLVVNIEIEIFYTDVFDKPQPLVVSYAARVVRHPKEDIRFSETGTRKGRMATYLPEALQGDGPQSNT